MLGNRYSQHLFSQIPAVNMARSQFDRSFTVKDTFDFDYLIPIFVDEVIPGDTFNLRMNTFGRLATQKFPVLDNMYLDYFFFFVPNRLVWENWESFIAGGNYVLPSLDAFPAGGPEVGTIWDKFGLPTDVTNSWTLSNCLPFRMYNLIYNDWFLAQQIQSPVTVNTDDGPDPLADYTLLKRGKRHDYFTSLLPSPQNGTGVTIPLGTSAPVLTDNTAIQINGMSSGSSTAMYFNSGTTTLGPESPFPASQQVKFGANSGLYTDLNSATAASINLLRQAFQIQSLLELDIRGGERYVELLLSHFNVTSPDFRLQRPEYLGGGSTRINTHPVANTSGDPDPVAQLSAFGTTSGQAGFTQSFTEHGYVIGLACARADVTYQQGLNRMWWRSTRYDFFWPKLQEIGDQAAYSGEINYQGANDSVVLGYGERYAEYRYKPSEIHGQFRSTYAASLDAWHLAEEFGSVPTLNSNFIQQNTPIDRIIATPGEPHLLFDAWFDLKCARPMTTYAVPLSLGRF